VVKNHRRVKEELFMPPLSEIAARYNDYFKQNKWYEYCLKNGELKAKLYAGTLKALLPTVMVGLFYTAFGKALLLNLSSNSGVLTQELSFTGLLMNTVCVELFKQNKAAIAIVLTTPMLCLMLASYFCWRDFKQINQCKTFAAKLNAEIDAHEGDLCASPR
jgi:hypothetical protein